MLRCILLSAAVIALTQVWGQKKFSSQYGNIETVAGTGKITAKGENGWKRAYENKPAIKAELSRPHFAMADEKGNIFIADKDAHAIRRVDVKTKKIKTVAGTGRVGDGETP